MSTETRTEPTLITCLRQALDSRPYQPGDYEYGNGERTRTLEYLGVVLSTVIAEVLRSKSFSDTMKLALIAEYRDAYEEHRKTVKALFDAWFKAR